jgi:hypothetical protein
LCYTSLLNVDAASCVTVVYLTTRVTCAGKARHAGSGTPAKRAMQAAETKSPTHCSTCAAALVTALAAITQVA